jgi:hypothetical protein
MSSEIATEWCEKHGLDPMTATPGEMYDKMAQIFSEIEEKFKKMECRFKELEAGKK